MVLASSMPSPARVPLSLPPPAASRSYAALSLPPPAASRSYAAPSLSAVVLFAAQGRTMLGRTKLCRTTLWDGARKPPCPRTKAPLPAPTPGQPPPSTPAAPIPKPVSEVLESEVVAVAHALAGQTYEDGPTSRASLLLSLLVAPPLGPPAPPPSPVTLPASS